jgi:hypothetical protein
MDKCRSCGAEIIWVKMQSGRNNPLDAKPTDKGNIDVRDGVGYVISKKQRVMFVSPLYQTHFATCPHAREWRWREDGENESEHAGAEA